MVLTEINLAPIHIRLGEGKGSSKRPTPYIATAKKCTTKLKGRGFKPESNDTGPFEKMPPRLKQSKQASRISCLASSGEAENTLYKAPANVLIVDATGCKYHRRLSLYCLIELVMQTGEVQN